VSVESTTNAAVIEVAYMIYKYNVKCSSVWRRIPAVVYGRGYMHVIHDLQMHCEMQHAMTNAAVVEVSCMKFVIICLIYEDQR
jgi:hypothetical protein